MEWNVRKIEGTVRVDVHSEDDLTETDTEAMCTATEQFLGDEAINTVQVDGPALQGRAPKGMGNALRGLDRLTRRYGVRLLVGPI